MSSGPQMKNPKEVSWKSTWFILNGLNTLLVCASGPLHMLTSQVRLHCCFVPPCRPLALYPPPAKLLLILRTSA